MKTSAMRNQLMRKELLRLLSARGRRGEQQGVITVAAGVVTAIVLILSGFAVVALTSGNLRGMFTSSETRQAQGAATEGADLMIATWNRPQNRRLLVSGADPATWVSGDALRSPCFNTQTGTRPGPNGDGLPDAAAIDLGDGTWRDVVTGAAAAANQNGRQFRLVRISYTASPIAAVPNPRGLNRTAVPGGGITGSALPAGLTSWSQLVNMNDPDGGGPLQPGRNSGFLILEVEGRVVRGGQVVSNSRFTQEFEVLPKCCGASLGSQNSGGAAYPAGTAGSLGSDGRLCDLQYGIVTGFNDGWHWSFFANYRFTQRDAATGQVQNYSPILGVVTNQGDLFQRSNCRVRPASGCARTDDPADSDDGDDSAFATTIANGSATPGTPPCRQSGPSSYYAGPQTDRDGTTASCVPIVPFAVANNFPPITDFLFPWTPGSGPAAIILAAAAQANKTANVALWPRLSTDDGDAIDADSESSLRLRTNNQAGAQRVEVCLVDLDEDTNLDDCADNTWLNVTAGVAPDLTTFCADSFGTPTGPACAGAAWAFSGTNTGVNSSRLRLAQNGRAVLPANISGLTVPYLSFFARRTDNWETTDFLGIEASPDNGSTWYPFARIFRDNITTSTSGTGSRVNLALPFVSPNFRLRFSTSQLLNSGEEVYIDEVRIESGRTSIIPGVFDTAFRGAWCEYSTTSPITNDAGFHCLGPTLDQWDAGKIFIDSSGGPLSFYYTEPQTTDLRYGTNTTADPEDRQENFIYLSRSPAELAHVDCGAITNNCVTPVPETVFASVGEPDRLNFFGRDSGTAGNEQNIRINTTFGSNAKIAGVWFYLPRGRVELRVAGGAANDVPAGFYTNDNGWSFSGRIWASQFKPFGAFHLRVPPSRVAGAALGQANAARYVPWNGIDWVARANTRRW